jgi:hypothetical protein
MSNRPAFTDAQWAAFTKAARKLLASTKIPLAGPNGEPGTKPEIDDHWVAFNGVGEDAHETAAVEREANEFEFCKTAEKPYDEVVVEFYKLVRKHLPSTPLSSDGGKEVFG